MKYVPFYRVNIQSVTPFSLNSKLNLISRTIGPKVDQKDIPFDGEGESGLGDVVQSLFFSPKAPTSGGIIRGVRPAFLLLTASDEALDTEKWGIGPTGVALKRKVH
jgi:hypothetical protein